MASRSSQTSRDTKLAFDMHIAMYLVYVPSKDQLPSATHLGSETLPAKDLKSIFAHQDCFGGRVFQENMLRGHVFLMPFTHTYSDLDKNWYTYRGHGARPKSRISSKSINRWPKYSYILLRSRFLRSFAGRNHELKQVVLES